MAELLAAERTHRIEVERDGGKLRVMKIFNNKKALEQNKAIRNANMMNRGQLGLHDKADIRMGISVPSTYEWELFKRKHPDIYAGIKSSDESERMKACKRLQAIEPEWVVQERL